MQDTAPVRNVADEKRKANTRRLVHEFAVYVVWHLSLTKPDQVAIRKLVNDMLVDWLDNGFTCDVIDCAYCRVDTNIANRSGFRSMYRSLIGYVKGGGYGHA